MAVRLTGLSVSVYTRIARLMLAERGIDYEFVEIDPFAGTDATLLDLNPLHTVPVLDHDGFILHETSAILRYLETAFDGVPMVPHGAKPLARMAQVISIVDSHGYWPMVRQVFAQRIFAPLYGEPVNEEMIAEGLRRVVPVLQALERIAGEGLVLNGGTVTLADLHLGPMVGYFQQAPEGQEMLARHNALSLWWGWVRERPAFQAVDRPVGPGGLASPPKRL